MGPALSGKCRLNTRSRLCRMRWRRTTTCRTAASTTRSEPAGEFERLRREVEEWAGETLA